MSKARMIGGIGVALVVTLGAAACGSFSTGYINTSSDQMADWPTMSHSQQMAIVRSELHRSGDPVTRATENDMYQALQDEVSGAGGGCTIDFDVVSIEQLVHLSNGTYKPSASDNTPCEPSAPQSSAPSPSTPAPAPTPAPASTPAPAPAAPAPATAPATPAAAPAPVSAPTHSVVPASDPNTVAATAPVLNAGLGGTPADNGDCTVQALQNAIAADTTDFGTNKIILTKFGCADATSGGSFAKANYPGGSINFADNSGIGSPYSWGVIQVTKATGAPATAASTGMLTSDFNRLNTAV